MFRFSIAIFLDAHVEITGIPRFRWIAPQLAAPGRWYDRL